jgi:hypothetical protein
MLVQNAYYDFAIVPSPSNDSKHAALQLEWWCGDQNSLEFQIMKRAAYLQRPQGTVSVGKILDAW